MTMKKGIWSFNKSMDDTDNTAIDFILDFQKKNMGSNFFSWCYYLKFCLWYLIRSHAVAFQFKFFVILQVTEGHT